MAPSRSPVLEAIIANLNSTSRSEGFCSISWKAASYSASSAAETVDCLRGGRMRVRHDGSQAAGQQKRESAHAPSEPTQDDILPAIPSVTGTVSFSRMKQELC